MKIQGRTFINGTLLTAVVGTLAACGQTQLAPDASATKIVGGQNVPESQNDARRFSTVALTTDAVMHEGQPPTIEQGHSFCSGTIIARRAVMTASHCIQKFDATTHQKLPDHVLPEDKDFLVYFGTTVSKAGKWVRATKAIPHPNWSPEQTLSPQPTSAPDDIGLIILSEDIPAGFQIAEIGEPTDTLPSTIKLAGYGVTSSRNNNDTGILRQVETDMTGAAGDVKRFAVGKFFAGACAGDSGGPAYVEKNGKLVVVGATSTGAEIAGLCLGLMNNYTDARYYKGWLADEIEANGAN